MAEKIPSIKELAIRSTRKVDLSNITREDQLRVDWPKIFTLFPRYCHILLVAPHHTSPDYTDYSIQGADDFFAFANPIATVKYLRDAQATPDNVEKELKNFNPRLVVHYDHGSVNAVYGETAVNTPQAVIDTSNAKKLDLRVMSTVSCLSAAGLGPTAVSKGCSSYVGYNDLHWIVTTTHWAFWNCAAMVHKKLTLGYNVKAGFDAAIAAYNANIAAFAAIGDTLTAVHLQMDRDRLTLVGSESARTCSFRLEIVWPLLEMVEMKRIPELVWPTPVLDLDREVLRKML